jgi:nitrite reductase/ring-hydroxylating ferredoxin subunit
MIQYEACGCPPCAFCNYPFLFDDTRFRFKSAARIADDWSRYAQECGTEVVSCLDSLFTVPPKRLRELCSLLVKRGTPVKWLCYARADDLAAVVAPARGRVIQQVGIESGDQLTANKRTTVRDNTLARDLPASGLTTVVSLVVGFRETRATLHATRDMRTSPPTSTFWTFPRAWRRSRFRPENAERYDLVTDKPRTVSPYWRQTMSCAEVGNHVRWMASELIARRVSLDATMFYQGILQYDPSMRHEMLDFQHDAMRSAPVITRAFDRVNEWIDRRLRADVQRALPPRLPLVAAGDVRGRVRALPPSARLVLRACHTIRRPLEVARRSEYVAFATGRQVHVLDGRCSHFGAHLARGTVVGDCLECPLHGWRFRGDGTCEQTPSGEDPPAAAAVRSYPIAMLGGHLFFHTDSGHRAPAPFFADVAPDDLISAPPFSFDVAMPWWMVSTNGFDTQHFPAHDRRLDAPVVQRDDAVFEARAAFDVVGGAWRDRVTRLVSGPRTEMTVRNAGGALILVTSRFRRTVTYGLVSIHPRSRTQSHVRTIVWKRPRAGPARAFDAVDVLLRASFIRAFIQPDIVAGEGIQFDPRRTIAADAVVTRYLAWLAEHSVAAHSDEPLSGARRGAHLGDALPESAGDH